MGATAPLQGAGSQCHVRPAARLERDTNDPPSWPGPVARFDAWADDDKAPGPRRDRREQKALEEEIQRLLREVTAEDATQCMSRYARHMVET